MNRPRKTDRNLPPCVYKNHGAFFYVKRGRWTRLGTTLPEALQAYAELHAIASGGMANLIDKVLAHVKPRLAKNTVRQYRVTAKHLKRQLVQFAPEQVKPKHVAGIKVAMAATPGMANRCLSFLKVVFQHAVEWQIVDSNPCTGVLRHREHKRTRYLTDAELVAIREKAEPRLQVVIDVCYRTGQRITDVLAIRRSDLTADGIQFTQKKTGVKLTVAWSPPLRAAVERAKGLYGVITAVTLFHNRRGKTPDYRTVLDQWRAACKAAEVEDAHIHDLRAKALTDAKREGKDATALAGHTSAAMTERYIRLRESPLVEGPGNA